MEQFYKLLSIALTDGELHENEKSLLLKKAQQIGLDETYYEGKIEQTYYSWDGQKKYDRFMVIGSK